MEVTGAGRGTDLASRFQVLRDRCQRELELCAIGAVKAQSAKPQYALEVNLATSSITAPARATNVGTVFARGTA
jgi:hypothetical protein